MESWLRLPIKFSLSSEWAAGSQVILVKYVAFFPVSMYGGRDFDCRLEAS